MEEQGIEDEEEVRPPLPPGMLPKSSVRRPKDPKDPKTSKKKDKNKKSWVLVNRMHEKLDISSLCQSMSWCLPFLLS